jgi:hypothetical protein
MPLLSYWVWSRPLLRWVCLLGGSVALPFYVWGFENLRPAAGVLFQFLGFVMVWLQLRGALERFKPPTIRTRLMVWLDAFPRPRVVQLTAMGSTSSTGAVGRLSVLVANRSLDERVSALEAQGGLLQTEIDKLRTDHQRELSELQANVRDENSGRIAGDDGLAATMSAHAVDGFEYQVLALCWAIEGVVLSLTDATWTFLRVWLRVAAGALAH